MKKLLLVFLLYFLVAIIYTYPLALKLGNSIYGYSGDNFGAIRYLWWWKYTFINHLDIRNSFLEQAPFGYKIDSETGSIFYFWPLKILTLIFNEVVAYNLVLLISFPAAALSVYLLVKFVLVRFFEEDINRRNTAIFLISLWSGFVFSFSPYHFWKAYNHLDLALLWTFPLAFLFLFKLLGQAKDSTLNMRTILLCAFFTAATVLTNFYYGFFLFISMAILYALVFIYYRPKFRIIFLSSLFTSLMTLLMITPFIAPTVIDAYVNKGIGQSAARVANYDRPLLDVVSLSARPWDYLIPSQDNPLFGTVSTNLYKWIRNQGKDFKVISGPVHERTIFIGFTSIFLVLFGISLVALKEEFRKKYGRFLVILLLITFILALVSMPPYIFLKGKFTIYLPSYFLYRLAPMFRTYSRLGIFVLMFVILFCSIVLKYLFRNISRIKLTIYVSLLVFFSVLEFSNVPPSKVTELQEPQAFWYIGQQPGDFSFIVYPKEFNVAELLAFQSQYKKGFLNFHSQSEYYKLWGYLDEYTNPRTYNILSSLGVKYVVFQKKLIFDQPNPVDDLWYTRALNGPIGVLPEGVVLEKDYGSASVYRVTADPVGFVVFGSSKTDVFPRSKFKLSGSTLKIYLANTRDNLGVKFAVKVLDISEREFKNLKVSGENVVITENSEVIKISLERDRGFIDISSIEKNSVIGSITVAEVK